MPNTVNYATLFERQLKQKYKVRLKTAGLTTADQGIRFVDANTVKVPYIIVQGYKDHSRGGGFNRQDLENRYLTKTLGHDRDVEFFVDSMDVDESNQALSAAKPSIALKVLLIARMTPPSAGVILSLSRNVLDTVATFLPRLLAQTGFFALFPRDTVIDHRDQHRFTWRRKRGEIPWHHFVMI